MSVVAGESTIRIEGKDYSFDDLTLGEIDEIEEICGAVLEDLDMRRAKVMKAVVYVVLKRDNPDLTLDDVGRIRVVDLIPDSPNGNEPV